MLNKTKVLNFTKKVCKSEIERLKNELKEEEQRTKDRNSYLLYLVEQYVNEQKIPTKDTKTQKSVKFATGQFIVKNPVTTVVPKDDFQTLNTYEPFISYLKECEDFELLKTKTEVKWGDIKKDITFDEEGNVIRESTGELLDFLTTKTSPKELKVNSMTNEQLIQELLKETNSQQESAYKKSYSL